MPALSTLTTTQTVSLSFLIINQGVTPFAPVQSTGGTLPVSYSMVPGIFTGLNFNTSTGYISGTPTSLNGIVNHVITVTDSGTGTDLQTMAYPFDLAIINRLSTSVDIRNKTITATIPNMPFAPVSATGGYGQRTWSIFPSLPGNLAFNPITGTVSNAARLGNTSTNYRITVTDRTPYSSTGTFTLTILPFKELLIPQPWETTGTIGTLVPGEISELYVKGQFSTSTVYINYSLISGSLPTGLTLNRDGTISGRPAVVSYDDEGGVVTPSTIVSNFTVAINDTNNNNLLNGRFSITVNQPDSTLYTEIYCKPFLTQTKRREFTDFIRNDQIFVPNLLYRPFDPYFGRQEELKLVIDFGVEQETLADYAEFISTNFYRRPISLGDLKTAVARNSDGSAKHEIIYIDIIDKHINFDKLSVPMEIIFNGTTYYPPSIPNMRVKLAIETTLTTVRNPKFMNSIQEGELINPGYRLFIPLCFTLPGKSPTIIRKIIENGFKFNTFNFEMDRIIVQNSLGQTGAKYLLLHRNSRLA